MTYCIMTLSNFSYFVDQTVISGGRGLSKHQLKCARKYILSMYCVYQLVRGGVAHGGFQSLEALLQAGNLGIPTEVSLLWSVEELIRGMVPVCLPTGPLLLVPSLATCHRLEALKLGQ